MTNQKPIALTLYNVRDELRQDFAGTLHQLREIGYEAIQLSGFDVKQFTPKQLRSMIDEDGFGVAGAHVSMQMLESDFAFVVETYGQVGAKFVICPSLPQERRQTADDYRRSAEQFNEIGRKLADQGLTFGYHNHDFEFQLLGEVRGMDLLLEQCDPTYVTFEPDVYWIAKAGLDPVAYVAQSRLSCPLVHIKDMASDANQSFAEIGEGTIEFDPIFEMQAKTKTEWYIVEQDQSNIGAMNSAALSFRNLHGMGRV